jgi:probable HAF family extracellular repeat protein
MMPRRWLKKFLVIFIAAVMIAFGSTLFTATQAATKFFYTVTELSSLGGKEGFLYKAYDINDSGQVVGYSYAPSGEMRSVLWENGAIVADWRLIGTNNYASAINNAGLVACNSAPNGHAVGRCPSLWEKGKFISNIGECGGYSYVNAINNAGQVAGYFSNQAFVWKDGLTTFLSDLSDTNNGGNSRASGINDKGQIVGFSLVSNITDNSISPTSHAVLWQPKGKIKDLGILPGGKYSTALDINQSGQVVGWADTSNKMQHAVLWEGGVIKDLGLLQDNATQALKINNRGTVVGYSSVDIAGYGEPVPQQAFVWKNGIMRDLNKLIPANSGWELNTARSINNRGQIVGEGKFNGQNRAYFLTPTWTTN